MNTQKLMQNKKLLAVLAVAIIGLAVLSSSESAQILSLYQCNIDTAGASVDGNGKVTGAYWTLAAYVEGQNVVQGFLLDNGKTSSGSINGETTTVSTKASVEVDIKPLQAYLIRDLQVRQVTVAPPAKDVSGSGTVAALTLQYSDWLESSFRIYTPYEVTVKRDGNVLTTVTINTQGSANLPQTIPTSVGNIIIQNLGGLSSTYLTPNTPSQVAVLNEDYIYDWAQIQDRANFASSVSNYAKYWYGMTVENGYAINPTVIINSMVTTVYYGFPGWEGAGTATKAVRPVIYSGDKSTIPYADKRTFSSLTEWFDTQGIANLGDVSDGYGVFSKYGGVSSMHIMTDYATGNNAMVITIPWGAYSTPLVSVRIPAEMADTWTEVEQISDVRVNGYWPDGSTSGFEVGAQASLAVDLTQQSSVTSSARIVVSSTDPRVSVYPAEGTTETLAPQQTKTVYFTVSQTGGDTDKTNVPITIQSFETYTGSLQSTQTVYCTLKATVGSDTPTTLRVYVKDNSTSHAPVVAMLVNVQYGLETGNSYTNNDGLSAFNLEAVSGGGYTGPVVITTTATETYPAAYKTVNVNPGMNDVTIVLGENGQSDLTWLLYLAAGLAAVAGVFVVLKKKKKGLHF